MTERVHRVQRVQATPRRIVVPPEQVPADPLSLKQQAVQRFTARPRTLQRQTVLPVLKAAALDRQEQTRLSQQQTQVQCQITALGEVTPVLRLAEPLAAPAKPITPADWVTVMRLRAEEVAGRPLDARSGAGFTALQRQVAQTLAQGFRSDRGDAQTRYATYGEHLATLQRHPVSAPVARVVLGLVPPAERLPLQRAVDETLQRFHAQEQASLNFDTRQTLQRQLAELDAEATQPVLQRIQARRGSGNPLPEAIQRHLEQGLNHDLSRVRIHDDAEADKLAKGVNAIAFTTGTDIFFQAGRFDPNTQTGLELLAHEVTHTVQQSQGKVGPGVDPDAGLESEAKASGKTLAQTFNPTKPVRLTARQAIQPFAPLMPRAAARRQAIQRSRWGADWWQQFKDKAVEQALELAAQVPNGAAIVNAFKSSKAVFQKVISNPSGCFQNLTGAVVNGFKQFKTHIGTHLQGALVDWLAGTSIAGTGQVIAFPKSLDARALLGFGMDVLGLNYANLMARLGARYGAEKVRKAESQFALLQQAKSGLHQLNDFRHLDQQAKGGIITAAKQYAVTSVAQQAVVWVSGFVTSGGLIPVVKTAFNLISTILQNASTFQSLGQAILGSISDIANGNVGGAALKVEQNLVRVIGLVLKFLSKMLGLDKFSGAIRKGITAIQKPVNTVIGKIVNSKPVQAFFNKSTGSTAKDKAGTASTNDLRSAADKKKDLDKAITAGTQLLQQKKFTPDELNTQLAVLKKQYQLRVLKVTQKQSGPLQVERHIYGEVNPVATGPAVVFALPETWQGTRKNPIGVYWPKPATARYPAIYLGGAKAGRKRYSNAKLQSLVGQPDPDVPGALIRKYKPHQRIKVASGDTIGLSGQNQVYTGKILKFDAALSSTTQGGSKFNTVAAKHGLGIQASNFNADHVLERQLGGADDLQNLWPLNGSINGSGGSTLHYMEIDLGGGIRAKVMDMKNTSRKYFLKVVSTL